MTDLKNFEDLIQECIGCDKNLLLGNGFSIACSNIFSYDSILNKSSFCNSGLFCDNSDYEKVIENLNFEKEVYLLANEEYETAQMYERWSEEIKWDLVNTLTKLHDKVYTSDKENHNTFLFLSNFNNIFTLNYDLLLYWVIIYAVRLYQNNFDYYKNIVRIDNFYPRDGFDRSQNEADCIWCQDKWTQNVFYLHGGLHLFCDSENTYKLKYDSNNNLSIIDKTKYWLNQETSPLVITEGNSDDKLKWIRGNHYLNYCYEQFCQIQGVLFIHGHSLDDKDKHIFDAINANPNIKAVYISIFDPITNKENMRQKANKLFSERIKNKSLVVDFYDAASVNIW